MRTPVIDSLSRLSGCSMNRRRFLGGCTACVGCSLGALKRLSAAEPRTAPTERARVRLVFACWALVQDRPTWPHLGYDMRPEIERVSRALRKGCPELELLTAVAHSPEDAKKILARHEADRIDGYLVYQMNNWVRVFPTIVASGHPTLVADFTYAGSGGFLVYTSRLRGKHQNFSVVSSSDIEDLVAAARCFRVLKTGGTTADFVAACDQLRRRRTPQPQAGPPKDDPLTVAPIRDCLAEMKKSHIVCVGGGQESLSQAIQQKMGITVHRITFEEFAAAGQDVDADEANQLAERWQSEARAVRIDQPAETLRKSARHYLTQRAIMKKYGAEAITINCLGGFYSGRLKAYPCLGYVELLNTGLIGACEADLSSTATMVAMRHLIGRPGYISDPVIDTSKRQIIYAHCVATTKPFGPEGPANPYEILTHSEDRRGASVRSLLPVGYLTSTLRIDPRRDEIIFHQGQAVENVIEDRACRTKLACEVRGDIEKLFTFWGQWGWHRVTYYGDLREPVKELAAALKMRIVEEA